MEIKRPMFYYLLVFI